MPTISQVHATFSQDVWPVATQMATTYAGGNGLISGNSYLDHRGPSRPYLKFTLGSSKAQTPAIKDPGIEVDWPEPLHLPVNGASLRVQAVNKYRLLPDRPLGDAIINLDELPPGSQVVDLQLFNRFDGDKQVMASVSIRVAS